MNPNLDKKFEIYHCEKSIIDLDKVCDHLNHDEISLSDEDELKLGLRNSFSFKFRNSSNSIDNYIEEARQAKEKEKRKYKSAWR